MDISICLLNPFICPDGWLDRSPKADTNIHSKKTGINLFYILLYHDHILLPE